MKIPKMIFHIKPISSHIDENVKIFQLYYVIKQTVNSISKEFVQFKQLYWRQAYYTLLKISVLNFNEV